MLSSYAKKAISARRGPAQRPFVVTCTNGRRHSTMADALAQAQVLADQFGHPVPVEDTNRRGCGRWTEVQPSQLQADPHPDCAWCQGNHPHSPAKCAAVVAAAGASA